MDFIVFKNKLYAKLVSWDLAAVEMSDQETIQKYLDDGYEPFGCVPHLKKENKSILTQDSSPNGITADNLLFLRKPNIQLSPVANQKEAGKEKENKGSKDEQKT